MTDHDPADDREDLAYTGMEPPEPGEGELDDDDDLGEGEGEEEDIEE